MYVNTAMRGQTHVTNVDTASGAYKTSTMDRPTNGRKTTTNQSVLNI